MRIKGLLLLMLAMLFPVIVHGERSHDYTIVFGQEEFAYEEVDSMVYIVSKTNDAIIWGDTLSPALPYRIVNVLISPNEEYAGVSYETEENLVMDNVNMAPNPLPVATNSSHIPCQARRVFYSRAMYPETCIEYTGTHMADGYKYLSFIVSPFRYDASTRKLYQNLSLMLHVQTTTNTTLRKSSYAGSGENMRNAVKSITINGDMLEELYPNAISSRTTNSSSPNYKYIIVTNDTLLPAFDILVRWKTTKGVRAKVVTVEECYTQYPNDSHQLAIKKVLADYYTNGMEYTLLGGDVEVVPVQMCTLPFSTFDSNETPSDLYYACLDNDITWDANGNQIYAEFADNPDFEPEYIVTRASVSTFSEAKAFVDRIVEYESYPNLVGWSNTMLSCGNVISGYRMKNGLQISDSQYFGEYNYENNIQPYWNGSCFELFDTYTDHPDGAAYAANPDHFQIELEKGYTFVDEFSHAWTTCWGGLEGSTVYTVDNAAALENCGNTVISTISCYSNAFDQSTNNNPVCLSEAFMRNPKSGILAYYGSSREGWLSTSNLFDQKFYYYLMSGDDKQFGRAATMSKMDLLGSISNSYYRWLELTLNPLGDPEMPVITCTPQKFQNVTAQFQNGNLTVTTGVDSCRICISSVADFGDSYYQVVDSVNTGVFSGITNDSYLCITKYGYIPYIARVGTSVFLQNESMERDLPIFSDYTFVGRDVTNDKANGPVIIEGGKVTNRSNNEATIMNDFEVKLGAELEIITNL